MTYLLIVNKKNTKKIGNLRLFQKHTKFFISITSKNRTNFLKYLYGSIRNTYFIRFTATVSKRIIQAIKFHEIIGILFIELFPISIFESARFDTNKYEHRLHHRVVHIYNDNYEVNDTRITVPIYISDIRHQKCIMHSRSEFKLASTTRRTLLPSVS